jgi:hypothetical protein
MNGEFSSTPKVETVGFNQNDFASHKHKIK